LKLKYGELLSNFASNFNLRRYLKGFLTTTVKGVELGFEFDTRDGSYRVTGAIGWELDWGRIDLQAEWNGACSGEDSGEPETLLGFSANIVVNSLDGNLTATGNYYCLNGQSGTKWSIEAGTDTIIIPLSSDPGSSFKEIKLTDVALSIRNDVTMVGRRCRLRVSNPVLKAPMVSALEATI